MVTMNEDEFFYLCDKCENMSPLDDYYYPTVEELKKQLSVLDIEKTLPILIYFASNPYQDNETISKNTEYQRVVNFANKYIKQNVQLQN